MLIDATHAEETRVAVVDDGRLVEFDYESAFRKPLKGNIYLAKVTRVEPSLQAAFVNFGGNRHGFLPFSEIHPDYFRIPVADREALMAEQEAALRQAEEAEAREEAEEAQYIANSAQDDEGDSDGGIEEIHDDHDSIEEIGGDVVLSEDLSAEGEEAVGAQDREDAPRKSGRKSRSLSASAPVVEKIAAEEEPEEDTRPSQRGHDQDGAGNDNDHEQDVDDINGNVLENESEEDGHHNRTSDGYRDRNGGNRFRRGQRGRRGRWNGGGRHHGGGQDSSQRVEKMGGDDVSEEQRFRFSLRRKYKIQEVIKRGQIMLVQVSKEERGNKGAAVGSYLSLPGRYCVLMPNSPRAGGVSRKIANYKDRAHMRQIIKDLEVPKGMSVILRTAGVSRTQAEIKRDLDYLMRLWDNIRELTLESTAPALVYEEANLVKRAVRDLYTREIDEVHVAGEEGFKAARNFMKMLMPSHTKKVIEFKGESAPLFSHYKIEKQIADIGETQVTLPSGGYLVINPTEALISIDVNSGKATKERHIEETALKTNMEAAAEVARQLRLRDLGGLVVIDFIDMEDRRNNAKVERRMRDALSTDRARIQMGRISSFGLMELSRQRLSPSLTESQFEICTHCSGLGRIRTADAASIQVLRAIEDEGIKGRASEIIVYVSGAVALYILNHKRPNMADIEQRYGFTIMIRVDETLGASGFRIDMSKPFVKEDESEDDPAPQDQHTAREREDGFPKTDGGDRNGRKRGRRGGRRRGGREREDREDQSEEHSGTLSEFVDEAEFEGEPDVPLQENTVISDPAKKPRNSRSRKAEPSVVDAQEEPSSEKAGILMPVEETAQEKPLRARRTPAKKDTANEKTPVKKRVTENLDTTPKAYEVVNEPPAVKKKGWWNKLVE